MRLQIGSALFVGISSTILFNLIYYSMMSDLKGYFAINIMFFLVNITGINVGLHSEHQERRNFYDLKLYLEDCALVNYEKEKIDFLLKAALPSSFVDRFPVHNIAEGIPSATVAFISLKNVIEYSDGLSSERTVGMLNEFFKICEARTQEFECEKIKTFQDKFMVVAGAPEPNPNHAIAICDLVSTLIRDFSVIEKDPEFIKNYPGLKIRIRVGISSGPIVAGVIGIKRFCWDIWGDTVNVASRMEDPKNGTPINVKVLLSMKTYELVKGVYACSEIGDIAIKGKGWMRAYELKERLKSRLYTRRHSEPRENMIPEFQSSRMTKIDFQLENWQPELLQDERETFFRERQTRNLGNHRLSMVLVIIISVLFAWMIQGFPIKMPNLVKVLIWEVIVPVWVFQFGLSWCPFYGYKFALISLSISTSITLTASCISQYVYLLSENEASLAIQFDSFLSFFNLASFFTYTTFTISPYQSLLPLFIGLIFQVFNWKTSGLPSNHQVFNFINVFVCVIIASLWVNNEFLKRSMLNWKLEKYARSRRTDLKKKKCRVRQILHNIIPSPYVESLSSLHGIRGINRSHGIVTILASDVVNFTQIADAMDPHVLVERLNELFTMFDKLTEKYSIEKVKTVGDAYIAAGGLFSATEISSDQESKICSQVRAIVELALDMHEEVAAFNTRHPDFEVSVRIGVHCGHVISGIIGHSKFQFDIFGQAVWDTDLLERTGKAWKVHVSDDIMKWIKKGQNLEDLVIEPGPGYSSNTKRKSFLLSRNPWCLGTIQSKPSTVSETSVQLPNSSILSLITSPPSLFSSSDGKNMRIKSH